MLSDVDFCSYGRTVATHIHICIFVNIMCNSIFTSLRNELSFLGFVMCVEEGGSNARKVNVQPVYQKFSKCSNVFLFWIFFCVD